eukprot:6105660-Alexandrium_andersonii.AAC.1
MATSRPPPCPSTALARLCRPPEPALPREAPASRSPSTQLTPRTCSELPLTMPVPSFASTLGLVAELSLLARLHGLF